MNIIYIYIFIYIYKYAYIDAPSPPAGILREMLLVPFDDASFFPEPPSPPLAPLSQIASDATMRASLVRFALLFDVGPPPHPHTESPPRAADVTCVGLTLSLRPPSPPQAPLGRPGARRLRLALNQLPQLLLDGLRHRAQRERRVAAQLHPRHARRRHGHVPVVLPPNLLAAPLQRR